MLRKLSGESKVGHTGTLDPDVTGVLPVCLGKATKLVGQLTDTDKKYACRMRFGMRTDTQDMTGKALESMPEEAARKLLGSGSRITETIRSFIGDIEQIPPMYSALKVDGMKLVNAARKGVVIERKPRKVTVYSIEDMEVSDDLMQVSFVIHCSKGTYVRTLCEDIGTRLGVPACMEELERTYAAGLDLESAVTLEEAERYAEEGRFEELLIPADRFLSIYPELMVGQDGVRKLWYGNYLYKEDLKEETWLTKDQIYRIYDEAGLFYALYRYDGKENCLKCVKMFVDTIQ